MKISVIMPSYLGMYPNCADKREERFVFAVESFLKQTFKDSNLCILSDGCDITEKIYNEKFKQFENITFGKIQPSSNFSAISRNASIDLADGEFICFLDTDDFIGENHLQTIHDQLEDDLDWVYYDDYAYVGNNTFKRRRTEIKDKRKRMVIGTSSICYRRELPIKWTDGYGHDHILIKELIEKYKFKKAMKIPQYFICHIPLPGPEFNIDKPNYCYS